jgi:GMP synthase-like glutamine amidotransferase
MTELRLLVFQHVDYVPLELFDEYLAAAGITPKVIQLYAGDAIPELSDFDALMVLGGPMNVWETQAHPWLVPEKVAIRSWVERLERPLLGICLGHQLLAEALGGEVIASPTPEADVSMINLTAAGQQHPLMAGFDGSKKAINMHGCEVSKLPPGAVRLASTVNCENAAFSFGAKVFGIQYHPEASDTLLAQWGSFPGGQALIEDVHGEGGVAMVSHRARDAMPDLRRNAEQLLNNFLAIARSASAGVN